MTPSPSTHPILHSTGNQMAAYAELPRGVRYRDQEENEEVEILLRQHIVTNFRWVIPAIIAFFVPTILHLIHPASIKGFEELALWPTDIVLLVEVFWYVLVTGYALENFLIWYFNVYLVTSDRVVDVDFLGLLRYESTEAELHQIQDVEHKQGGLWQLLFNYGTVEVQTAGTRQNIVFTKVPKPNRVADIITDLLPKDWKNHELHPTPETETLV